MFSTMATNKYSILTLLVSVVLSVFHCVVDVETEPTITAELCNPGGGPACNVLVTLKTYHPSLNPRALQKRMSQDSDVVDATYTNQNGHYEFYSIQNGRFLLCAYDADSNWIRDSIGINDSNDYIHRSDTLKPPVRLELIFPRFNDSTTASIRVLAPGLNIVKETDTGGIFIFKKLPVINFNLQIAVAKGNDISYFVGNFTAKADEVTTINLQTLTPLHRIVYIGNGNTSGAAPVDKKLYEQGEPVILRENSGNLAKEGFGFIGWNTNADGSGALYRPGTAMTMDTVGIALYAQWEINKLTLTYNGNGNTAGNAPVGSIVYDSGAAAVAIGNTGSLVKTGFSFIGWNTKPDGSGITYLPGDTLNKGNPFVLLYAQWKNPDGMKLIKAAGKSFQMGSNSIIIEELPVHTVTLSSDFWMDSTEVTMGKFLAIIKWALDSQTAWSGHHDAHDTVPAHNVNWYDAALYCNALTKATGSTDTVYSYGSRAGVPTLSLKLIDVKIDLNRTGFHLPTEAQWEYACRGGTTTDFFWGKNYGPYPATGSDSSEVNRHAVWWRNNGYGDPIWWMGIAHTLPNAYGLYDMSGNLEEWCNDWYGDYDSVAQTDPTGPFIGAYRVCRGGHYDQDLIYIRSSARNYASPDAVAYPRGIRVCLTVNK